MWYKELLRLLGVIITQRILTPKSGDTYAHHGMVTSGDLIIPDRNSATNAINAMRIYTTANLLNLDARAGQFDDGLGDSGIINVLSNTDEQFSRQRPQNSTTQFASSWVNSLVSSYVMKGAPAWTQTIGALIDTPSQRPIISSLLSDSPIVNKTMSVLDKVYGLESADDVTTIKRQDMIKMMVDPAFAHTLQSSFGNSAMDVNHYIPFRMLASYRRLTRPVDAIASMSNIKASTRILPALDLFGAQFYSQSYAPPIPEVRGSVLDLRKEKERRS